MGKQWGVSVEFHISREARDRYLFDEQLFAWTGNVLFANFHAARLFAQKMNERRDLVSFPEQAVRAGHVNAMGLIDEILHLVVRLYRGLRNPAVIEEALQALDRRPGAQQVDETLRRFVDHFPPVAVYRGEIDPAAYLAGETDGVPNRQIALEEMLALWLANVNPACAPFLELFDDAALEKETAYLEIAGRLHEFFADQPGFGPDDENLLDMLRSPSITVPHSLPGQLEYIREKWGYLLGRHLYRLLGSLDVIKEEQKIGLVGRGPTVVIDFAGLELEPERFSPDLDWMPKAVMTARNTYVWLDQLGRRYGRPTGRLDQIPDEELDTLARQGFTGLWLIGLWERSTASRRIKQMMGNPEAVASAYSLFDYEIAADLGGEAAFQNLRDRAWRRGIRLASDMVPNHMGIDSRWVIEHPDWFVALDHSPFPSYRFTGPNLSSDDRAGIYLEDHYYDRTDAAVVFKRVDHRTGQERYIYHGNDGTSMPWNDTAQLDFLKAEVREAVIQTILHVARKFPIIRFDAAMTLARRHYQRLWFPQPGSGGAIPSRADHGLTKADFEERMPAEFWREVVDRVAEEVPDTLLLAEAFWLMEGYFVRTLGMHRVYNSAFMNMLRDEDNAGYRSVMKNTLEFDPRILKRYVNFMNNPDEETAVAQFGKDDKYFGVCTLMATLPGLPMFGHGQIEGFTEKYGMEYRRAYRDEEPDQWLVERHRREIFPLLRKRYLFAEVENFLLYDFFAPDGHVNEDVFAYSNRAGEERVLVVYHNKYAEARGWIRTSVAFPVPAGDDGRALVQKSLGDGLGLRDGDGFFTIFRDHKTGLEFVRSSRQLREEGLYVELGAFKYHVFLDFRQVRDNEWHHYAQLADYLDGRGVPSIEEALNEVLLQPVRRPFKELVNAGLFRRLLDARIAEPEQAGPAPRAPSLLDEVEQKTLQLLREARQFAGGSGDEAAIAGQVRRELEAILQLPALESRFQAGDSPDYPAAAQYLLSKLDGDPSTGSGQAPSTGSGQALTMWAGLLGWLFVHSLGQVVDAVEFAQQSRSWIDEWLLGRAISEVLQELGVEESAAWQTVTVVKLLTTHQRWFAAEPAPGQNRAQQVLQSLLRDDEVQRFLQVNRYQDVLWFSHQAFEHLAWWLFAVAVVDSCAAPGRPAGDVAAEIAERHSLIHRLLAAEAESQYQVEKLFEALETAHGLAS